MEKLHSLFLCQKLINSFFYVKALWTRFFPIIEKLKHEISSQTIGPQVNYFCGTFLAPIKDVERLKSKELGGGAILEYLFCILFY